MSIESSIHSIYQLYRRRSSSASFHACSLILQTSYSPPSMFEISWVDPTSETVGQRKSRKEGRPLTSAHEGAPQQYQASSIQSSRSTKSLSGQAKPSLLKASPGNTAPALIRIGSHFNPSNSLAEQSAGGYERIFPFTASSGPLILEDTARIPLSDTYTGAFCN
jgi:hypothetical protein